MVQGLRGEMIFESLHSHKFSLGFTSKIILKLNDMLAKRHFGLAGMYERAKLIGADISITSKPRQGTKVQVTWKSGTA